MNEIKKRFHAYGLVGFMGLVGAGICGYKMGKALLYNDHNDFHKYQMPGIAFLVGTQIAVDNVKKLKKELERKERLEKLYPRE